MASFWILNAARTPIGPYEDEHLRQLATEGKLAERDLVCESGSASWVAASSVRPSFFRGAHTPPTPPPPPPVIARPLAHMQLSKSNDAAMELLLPVSVDPLAVVAGYLGLLSPALVPAPIALVLGLVVLRRLKADSQLRGAGRAWFAVGMGGVGTIVGLVLFVANL